MKQKKEATESIDKTSGRHYEYDLQTSSFSYPDEHKVLDQIKLVLLTAGEKICVMGTFWFRKIYLIKAYLPVHLKISKGVYLINDIPIGNYNLGSLRAATGILLSQQDIFQGTLWENITMGNKDIRLSDITDMIEKCGLTSFLESLA